MVPSEPLVNEVQPWSNSLEHWLLTPPGQYVMGWERPHVDRAVNDVFGFHAVQLGLPGIDLLAESRMPNRWRVVPQALPDESMAVSGTITADFHELPFASQSVDLVVAPHVLEVASDPHQVLREIDRILIPEGRLLVTGLNPFSLWGLRQGMRRRAPPVWPSGAQPWGVPRLRDLLLLLSFEVERGRFGCYRWPSVHAHRLQSGAFMEKAGDRWWPMCGAAYLLGAVKRTRKMTLIGPRWRQTGLTAIPAPSTAQPSRAASQSAIQVHDPAQPNRDHLR
jgi:SAM-dependent methyltransferase